MSVTIFDQIYTTVTGQVNLHAANVRADDFTPSINYSGKIQVLFHAKADQGAAITFRVRLYTGTPPTDLVYTANTVTPAGTTTTDMTATFNNINLVGGTQYWIVFDSNAAGDGAGKYAYLMGYTSTGGESYSSTNDAASWSSATVRLSYRVVFTSLIARLHPVISTKRVFPVEVRFYPKLP